jgi:hypothetical protein
MILIECFGSNYYENIYARINDKIEVLFWFAVILKSISHVLMV